MRPRARSQLKFDLTSFSFLIAPKEITFEKKKKLNQGAFYCLEIEKGVQLVGSFPQKITPNKTRTCPLEIQPLRIKIPNPKTAAFSFSLYLYQQDTISFVDSFSLDLLTPYQRFTKELNNHQYEYSRIMEIVQNELELGHSWTSLKKQLKEYKHRVEVQGNTAKIEYFIEIESEIDEYAAKMEKKNVKVLTKTSQESKKSDTSSQQKQVKIKEEGNGKMMKCQTTTNFNSKQPSSLSQQQTLSVLTPELSKNSEFFINDSPEIQQPSELPLDSSLSPEPVKIFLPLQSILQNRRNQNLSDIIEQSYEGDSNFNSNQRTDRKWKDLPEIKQEKYGTGSLDLRKRKTETFLPDREEDEEEGMRRGGSLDEIHNAESENEIQENNFLKKIEEESVEESLPHTRDSFSQSLDSLQQEVTELKNRKILLLLSLFIVCWLALSAALLTGKRGWSRVPSLKNTPLLKHNIRTMIK